MIDCSEKRVESLQSRCRNARREGTAQRLAPNRLNFQGPAKLEIEEC